MRAGVVVLLILLGLISCSGAGGVSRATEKWQISDEVVPLSVTPHSVTQPDQAIWQSIPALTRLGAKTAVIRIPVMGGAGRTLYIPASTFAMRVYCDSKILYSFSDETQFTPRHFRGWAYHVVDLDQCTQGILYFHVYSALNVRFVIPHSGTTEDVIRFLILNAIGPFIVVVICGLLGCGFFLLFLIQTDRLSGSLSLFLLCTGIWLFGLNPLSKLLFHDHPLWAMLAVTCLYASPAGFALFAERIMPGSILFRNGLGAAVFILFAAAALFLDLTGVVPLYRSILPFNVAVLCVALLTAVQLIRGLRHGRHEARILGIGVACLIAFAVHDMLLAFSTFAGVIDLRVSRLHYGMLGFILSMVGVAANQWKQMQNDIHRHSRELERKVNERTAHLENALAAIRANEVRVREEIAIASSIQRQLLLQLPIEMPGLRISGCYLPMHDVSGDFYDVYYSENGSVIFFLADAVGHGVPAALIMSMLKAIFIESAPLFDDPSWILAHMNNRLEKHLARTGNYATGTVLFIPEKGPVLYANAANRPAVILREEGPPEWLDGNGLILGAFPQQPEDYTLQTVELAPGDRILLFTDGVTEQTCENDAFGEERLFAFLQGKSHLESEALTSEILGELARFAHKKDFDDDVTICVMERLGKKK